MRFGPSAVKTPGRTYDNHCVTKGLKVSLKPFQRLGVAHVGRSPRPEDPKGQSPVRAAVQGGAPVALRRERNSFRIFPEGAFLRPALTGRYAPLRARLLRRRRVSERNRRRRLLARRGFAYFLFERKKES